MALTNILFLSACNAPMQVMKFKPGAIDAGMSAVILYRPGVMSNAIYSPQLYVDDSLRTAIKNRRVITLQLVPGEHVLDIDREDDYQGETRIPLTVDAGRYYYFRVDTALRLNPSSSYQPYLRRFDLQVVSSETAISEITACCMNRPVKSDKMEETSIEKEREPDTGFSVEKTQNPFSH